MIEKLNKVCEGWTQTKSGMLINFKNKDIIDRAPATNKWFIIAEFGVVEGCESCEEAVEL